MQDQIAPDGSSSSDEPVTSLLKLKNVKLLRRKKSAITNKAKSKNITETPDLLTCNFCSANFISRRVLQGHLKIHYESNNDPTKPATYQCIVCPRTFSSSDGLKYHLATHTGEKRYGCHQCGKRFIKRTHLSEHIATHSDVKEFRCSRCPRTFTTWATCKKHMRRFPGPHNFECDQCGKIFSKESRQKKHVCFTLERMTLDPEVVEQLPEDVIEEYMCITEEADKEAVEKGLKSCYKCFQVFPNMAALHDHQKDHVGKQIYKCRFCKEMFYRADDFSVHISNHLGSAPYMCLHCNRKFISPFTLAMHSKKNPGPHNFTCSKCKRWFPSSWRLAQHDCILQLNDTFTCACGKSLKDWNELCIHAGSKPFRCCVCDQKFVTLTTLVRHLTSHTGIKPYGCTTCGRKFRFKLHFLNHCKKHDKAGKLTCELCGYSAFSQTKLNIHLFRKHDVEVPTSTSSLCPYCGLLFPSEAFLKRHTESIHKNVLPESNSTSSNRLPPELCNLCGKMLRNKYSLALHLKKVHGPNPLKAENLYKCWECKKPFKSAVDLKQHRSSHEKHDPPYTCPTCRSQFTTYKQLTKHLPKHNTQKPYSCLKCGKRFKVACSLKYHGTICGRDRRKKKSESFLPERDSVFVAVEVKSL